MNDPRLNSLHLEFPRREDFRKARQALLDGRGLHTLALEKQGEAFGRGDAAAPASSPCHSLPSTADYWLMDHESIYPLRIGLNTIGRLPDNDVVIEGPYVSRRHCAILIHVGDGCELYDIASKNGTYVNGLRLCGPTHLEVGDEIRMCDRQFVFMSKTDPRKLPGHGSTRIGG